jgi:hypothetical protein
MSAYEGGIPRTPIVDPLPALSPLPDSVTVIPGPEYQAGWLHRVLFGEHYRDLWATPMKVKVLNLEGFTPVKMGGGYQTKSLRLKGSDGKLYVFRSVNKDPKRALPLELQDTFAADVAQDQISSSNPAGALVVDVLADALGVLHPKPTLALMPDDERLGQYRETFAGILGIFEDYPAVGEDGTPGFAGSDKIVSTIKLFETLEKDNNNVVNAEALLTARLLDVFVGDWDRHIDQWRWARFMEDGRAVWYPIPRDRDQAFTRFDGLLPSIGAKAITQLEHFDEHINDIASLTFSGRFVDRRLLVSLDRQAWERIAHQVSKKLTDEVIENAVAHLPPEFYAKRGAWLTKALKSRRDGLKKAAETYYRLVSDYVDVHFSDDPEDVDVQRIDDDRVEVVAYQRQKDSGERGRELFRRTFRRDETKEIRLYLHGGNDRCTVRGKVESSIDVRVIGGGGDDELVDESHVRGVLWGFIPFIPQAECCTYFYDDKGNNTFVAGPSCTVDKTKYEPPPPGLIQY